jgi:hypothetical protein
MAIKHVKVVTTADDGTSEVGTDEWNDNHTIEDNTITNDHLTGSIAQSKITNLTTDLTSKAPIASPTFTGTVVLPNVPAIVTTQLDLKSPLASPTFTGTVVLPNVPAIVTTQLDLKSPLASPTFTGTVTTSSVDVAGNNIDNVQNLIHDIDGTSGALNFSDNQLQTDTISSNTTYSTPSNIAIGRSKTVKLLCDGTTRTLSFPAWKFVGVKPTEIVANKTAILTLTCFGTTDADIVAGYAVEE